MEYVLEQFGFSRQEGIVYAELLASGGAKVSDIAKQMRIKRTSCQEYIRSLEEKGFVNASRIGNKFFYQAEDPDKFLQMVHEREYIVDRLIPELRQRKKEKPWSISSIATDEAARRMRRAKRKKGQMTYFGKKDVGGALIGGDCVILWSRDREIPAIQITSEAIVSFHRDVLKI